MRFTFKKEKQETGLSGVGTPYPDTAIKLQGKVVGYICAPTWRSKDNKWGIRFTVRKEVTKEDPAPFKWVQIRARLDSEPEAREFLNGKIEEILEYFSLYEKEDD